jgi:hypothetical protein
MGNDNGGPTDTSTFKSFLYNTFRLGVQSRSRFIKQQYLGIRHNRSRNSNSLFLATRNQESSLSDIGIVASGKVHDKVVSIRLHSSLFHQFEFFGIGCVLES